METTKEIEETTKRFIEAMREAKRQEEFVLREERKDRRKTQ